MVTVLSQCFKCKYYNKEFKCGAFPNGIPEKVYLNQKKHDKILPNQINNYIFEISDNFKNILILNKGVK